MELRAPPGLPAPPGLLLDGEKKKPPVPPGFGKVVEEKFLQEPRGTVRFESSECIEDSDEKCVVPPKAKILVFEKDEVGLYRLGSDQPIVTKRTGKFFAPRSPGNFAFRTKKKISKLLEVVPNESSIEDAILRLPKPSAFAQLVLCMSYGLISSPLLEKAKEARDDSNAKERFLEWFREEPKRNNLKGISLPSPEFFDDREKIKKRLEKELDVKLEIFGSSKNLFGSENSDLDMCVSSPEDRREVVRRIGEKIRNSEIRDTARVPIVIFKDETSGLECDVSAHNPLAIKNTELLKSYASIDPRVREAAFVVKKWAKSRDLNNPSSGTLSSYGYVLMLLHYLQTIRFLPVLQRKGTKMKHPFEENRKVDLTFDPPTLEMQEIARASDASVSDLVAGFFRYYSRRFDFRNVVSIRGRPVSKLVKAQYENWPLNSRLAIEDPFEIWYDVAHVLKGSTSTLISSEIKRAYDIMSSDDDALASLCSPPVR